MTPTGSVGDWLNASLLDAPPDLARRMRASIPSEGTSASVASGVEVLASAAASELRALLADGCGDRSAAPGLLTVDALVTQACELLAVTGEDVESGALIVLERLMQGAAEWDEWA
ncbi:MAG: hypothetical protein M3R65_08255 [Gemmatimonadota bacterium]|nr:hypothetical protein [Gemmatimonadota bacterium]